MNEDEGGNFDQSIFMQNCIVDAMVRRNWQKYRGVVENEQKLL